MEVRINAGFYFYFYNSRLLVSRYEHKKRWETKGNMWFHQHQLWARESMLSLCVLFLPKPVTIIICFTGHYYKLYWKFWCGKGESVMKTHQNKREREMMGRGCGWHCQCCCYCFWSCPTEDVTFWPNLSSSALRDDKWNNKILWLLGGIISRRLKNDFGGFKSIFASSCTQTQHTRKPTVSSQTWQPYEAHIQEGLLSRWRAREASKSKPSQTSLPKCSSRRENNNSTNSDQPHTCS